MSRFAIVSLLMLPAFLFVPGAEGGGKLLVAVKGDDAVGVFDPDSGHKLASIPEGGKTGHELVASPDGKRAYVPIYGDSGVGKPGSNGTQMVVVDLASQKVINRMDFGPVRPHCPVLGPKNGMLYVTTELNQTVSIVNPKTLKIVGTIPTGQAESHMLTISSDGKRGYTANVGPGTVSVLDLDAKKTLKIIPISGQTQRIAISPDNSMVFTSDQTKPQLAVIDTATNTVKTWVPLPGSGYGTAPTADGRWLLVAVPKTKQVAVVDLRAMKVAQTIDVPNAPQEVLIRPDGKMAYVSCSASKQVAMISIPDWKVQTIIDAGPEADGLAWASGQ